MREAVVVASSRTPLAKRFRGSFNLTRPDDLSRTRSATCWPRCRSSNPAEIEDVDPGLRLTRRAAGDERGARSRPCGPDLPVTVAGHDGQPLLLVRPAGHRHGRARDRPRRAPMWPSAAASRASRMHCRRRQARRQSVGVRAQARPSTWSWATRPRSSPSATRSAARRRTSTPCSSQQRTARAQREGFFDEELRPMQSHARHPRQEDRRSRRPRRALLSTRTSATGPTRRSRGCWR